MPPTRRTGGAWRLNGRRWWGAAVPWSLEGNGALDRGWGASAQEELGAGEGVGRDTCLEPGVPPSLPK